MMNFKASEIKIALNLESESGVMVIAEVAQAHEGSLGMAHAYIDAVANAGADAVKFQTHLAAAESTPGEPWRVKFSWRKQGMGNNVSREMVLSISERRR